MTGVSNGAFGYTAEGSEGHCFVSQWSGTRPLLRFYSPATGDHFYTTDTSYLATPRFSGGYQFEGTECYTA